MAGSPDYGEKKPSSPGQSSGKDEGNVGALLRLMRVSCSSICSPRFCKTVVKGLSFELHLPRPVARGSLGGAWCGASILAIMIDQGAYKCIRCLRSMPIGVAGILLSYNVKEHYDESCWN